MHVYKEFVQRLRKLTLEDEYLILIGDITPNLKNYVRSLSEVKFVDGSYHTYYGEMKNIINSFINFNVTTVDNTIKEADKYSNVLDNDKALNLMETTIGIHVTHQIDFGKEFLPVTCSAEKKIYDEVMEKYDDFIPKLYDLRSRIERLDRPDKLMDFANEHFKISIKETGEMFRFTHLYIALMLVDRSREIKVSLEEILLRLNNNLRRMKQQRNETLHNLLNKLYEKNKEVRDIFRKSHKSSVEFAEISHGIDLIRNKIQSSKLDTSMAHLEEEVAYWRGKVNDFRGISATVDKLRVKLEEVTKQREIYNSLECKELPGEKQEQWKQIGRNCEYMGRILKEKMIEVGRVIITFFSVRGSDHILHQDNIGSFYSDEYNHKVYQVNYGLKNYHLSCEGDFKEISDNKTYLYDEHGRHIYENGCKYYQLAPCTSWYKLGEDGLFNKVTRDPEPSVTMKENWKLNVKELNSVEQLPATSPVNTKCKLEPDEVKYLWDNLGHILPDALHEISRDKSKNPIQHLAHKILFYKYNRSYSEQLLKRKDAETFRDNVYKDRKEKMTATSKAWKAKQVKRRKPEESDDAEDRAVFDAQFATQHFIRDLGYYDN